MEKIRKNVLRTITVVMFFALAAFVISCDSNEGAISPGDSANVASEAATDSYFEEVDDITSSISQMDDGEFTQGRLATGDDRFCDDTHRILLNDDPNNSDTIIIDYGNVGCMLRGHLIKGKIIIIFPHEGNRHTDGFAVSTTFVDFYIDGVKFEGTRTIAYKPNNVSEFRWEITLDGGKITWPDGTFATRDAHHFRRWDRNELGNFLDDEFVIEEGGEAAGVNRRGKQYSMVITEDIVFKAACMAEGIYMPVSGVKVLTVAGKTATIDYGDGECDKIITITINGDTRNITAERD